MIESLHSVGLWVRVGSGMEIINMGHITFFSQGGINVSPRPRVFSKVFIIKEQWPTPCMKQAPSRKSAISSIILHMWSILVGCLIKTNLSSF